MATRWQMVTWHGAPLGEPVVLFAEVEDEFEVRKVDLFADGSMRRADRDGGDESTWLSSVPMTSIEEIDIQPEFTARDIEKELFEAVWNAAGHTNPDRG